MADAPTLAQAWQEGLKAGRKWHDDLNEFWWDHTAGAPGEPAAPPNPYDAATPSPPVAATPVAPADAVRYQWLRRWKGQEHEPLFTVRHEIEGTLWGPDLDAAIDAAMLDPAYVPTKTAQPQPLTGARSAAYYEIDRFLRNNLGDEDYAEYSKALDLVTAPSTPTPPEVAP